MKLSSFKRLITQDFEKEFHKLVEQLGSTINDSFNSIYFALNKRLTFADNFAATVRDIDLSVDANGIPTQRIQMGLDVQNTRVIGTIVIQVNNLSNPAILPAGSPFISYTQNENTLIINKISGLQPNYLWRIKVVAIN